MGFGKTYGGGATGGVVIPAPSLTCGNFIAPANHQIYLHNVLQGDIVMTGWRDANVTATVRFTGTNAAVPNPTLKFVDCQFSVLDIHGSWLDLPDGVRTVAGLQEFAANGCTKLLGVDLSGITTLTTLNLAGDTNCATLNLTGCTAVTSVDCSDCPVPEIVGVPTLPDGINASGCALTPEAQDAIIAACVAGGQSNKTLNLGSQSTGVGPTSASDANLYILAGNGYEDYGREWTIVLTEE
jgi:hypothetical protein